MKMFVREFIQCRTFPRIFYRVRNAWSAFYTRVRDLYPVRNAQSAFYTWVRVLYLVDRSQ